MTGCMWQTWHCSEAIWPPPSWLPAMATAVRSLIHRGSRRTFCRLGSASRMDEGIVEMTTRSDNAIDPGLSVLVMLLGLHGIGADPEQIRHRLPRGQSAFHRCCAARRSLVSKLDPPGNLGTACQCAIAGIVGLRDGGFLLLGKSATKRPWSSHRFRRGLP